MLLLAFGYSTGKFSGSHPMKNVSRTRSGWSKRKPVSELTIALMLSTKMES
jgi:hypothetical protein